MYYCILLQQHNRANTGKCQEKSPRQKCVFWKLLGARGAGCAELDKWYLTDQQTDCLCEERERVKGFLFTMSQTCPHYMLSRAGQLYTILTLTSSWDWPGGKERKTETFQWIFISRVETGELSSTVTSLTTPMAGQLQLSSALNVTQWVHCLLLRAQPTLHWTRSTSQPAQPSPGQTDQNLWKTNRLEMISIWNVSGYWFVFSYLGEVILSLSGQTLCKLRWGEVRLLHYYSLSQSSRSSEWCLGDDVSAKPTAKDPRI